MYYHRYFLEVEKLVECYLNHLQNLKNRRYLKHHHLSRFQGITCDPLHRPIPESPWREWKRLRFR